MYKGKGYLVRNMSLKDKFRILELNEYGDERGNLVVAEGEGKDIPFRIKRVFYMYGSDATTIRGQHANLHTEFVLINVAGTSKVRITDGTEEVIVELNRPRMGLYIPNMLWKDMYDFSADSVLLVMASEHFDETEYVRDFEKYMDIMKGI